MFFLGGAGEGLGDFGIFFSNKKCWPSHEFSLQNS